MFKLFWIHVCFLLISTVLLCQCAKPVNSFEPIATVKKKQVNPYSLPTATYLALAKNQEGNKKQTLLLSAAGRMISEGQWQQALTILAQTDDLTDNQLNEKKILLAKIDLLRDKPTLALSKLAAIRGAEQLSNYQQIQFHEVLAQSYRAVGSQVESILQRIKLDLLLVDQAHQVKNRRILWLTLINLPQAELNTIAEESADNAELTGWIKLADISRKYRDNPQSLLAALAQWQSHFHEHPANSLLPNPLESIAHKMIAKPQKIALLLPLSGTLSGPGQAIRQGFMNAYETSNDKEKPQISFYDTDKEEVAELYKKALDEGAQYVVGPLTKHQVATIAALEHPVPTLLLNDFETDVQDNSYLFGLSPVNEAIQVAVKAKDKGYRRALIIAPKNDWGSEITKAFTNQWQDNGGQIVDTLLYSAADDMNKKVQDFLKISDSQRREKQLKQLLGANINTIINRRQDFDMIFLLAYPSKARQIMPLLKYYYAGDIPVFATSSVYSGSANALKDKDLDGIIFCDIPWVFSHQMGAKNWPEQFNSYNRLYALGKDSYALASQLNQLILFPADGSMDASGILYLKSSRQVMRVLEWAQFRQGLAHSMGSTTSHS